jgi:cobalt-zinc-cadmium efflux system outer membrane protein
VEQALSQRPEIRLARELLTVARAQETLEQSRANPTFDWVAGYKRTLGLNTALVGLQVDLPFSNRNQGNIQAAAAAQRAAQADLAAAEALVRAEVSHAYAEYETRRQQVRDYLPSLRTQAAETAKIAAAAYREGGADLLRLLDAERLRLDVELVAYRALIEYRQSIVTLEIALGVRP